MNRDDIARMAKEAGFQTDICRYGADVWIDDGYYVKELTHFAALVASEKEQQMIRDGWRKCAEGQRTTQFCGLLDAAVKAEREECAKVAESFDPHMRLSNHGLHIANKIRARTPEL